MTDKDLMSHLLSLAIQTARKAGDAIMDIYNSSCMDISYKEDNSPLTAADRLSHDIISEGLSSSGLPILSEEGQKIPYDERKSWEYFWLVDPLDGTKEFIKRNGEFTVNIALIDRNIPVIGVIYLPVNRELYFAADMIGAYKLDSCRDIAIQGSNDNQGFIDNIINNSKKLPLEHVANTGGCFTVLGSRSHASEEFERYLQALKREHPGLELISAGSSIKFCLVAEGKADIYPRLGPTMEWDTAAGQCIVEQAGGKVLDEVLRLPLHYNKNTLANSFFSATSANNIAQKPARSRDLCTTPHI